MRPSVFSKLVFSVRFLAALAGGALIVTRECETAIVAAYIAFALLGLRLNRFPQLYKWIGRLQPVLAVFALAAAFVDFFYLSNSFLIAVAHFLLLIQGLRLLVLQTSRENLGSILLSSLMMLSAATLSIDWGFFLMLTVFLPLVIWSLMLHTIAMEGGADAAPLSTEISSALRQALGTAFTVAAVCCTMVFIIFPRFNFQGFRGQFLQPVHRTGITNQVNLGQGGGRIYEDTSVAMRVEIDPKERAHWKGYIRGAALTHFEGSRWKKVPGQLLRVYAKNWNEIALPIQSVLGHRHLRQTIYLESLDTTQLFSAAMPTHFFIERPFLEIDKNGGVQRSFGDTWRVRYDVESVLNEPRSTTADWMSPLSRKTSPGDDIAAALALPLDPVNKLSIDRIHELAIKIRGTNRTALQSAQEIERYLMSNFSYTLENAAMPKEACPVEVFLFDRKKGHCEYFASAMCVMLRSIGIPARMVTGFVAHEWNDRGSYYVVRMKDAHAWVEAYVAPYGWLGFDPTPRDFNESAPGSALLKRLSEMTDYLNLEWSRYVLNYDMQRQLSIVKNFTETSHRMSWRLDRLMVWFQQRTFPRLKMSGQQNLNSSRSGRLLLFGVILMGGVAGWIVWQRRRQYQIWFYPRLVGYLQKKGARVENSSTLRELTDSVRSNLGENAVHVEFLKDVYYRLRFQALSTLTPAEQQQIKSALNALR